MSFLVSAGRTVWRSGIGVDWRGFQEESLPNRISVERVFLKGKID